MEGFWGLWSREFWKRWSVGFCKDSRGLWVVLGQEWPWNGEAEVLEFWVRLGGELWVVRVEMEALVSVERRRRKS